MDSEETWWFVQHQSIKMVLLMINLKK